MTVNVHTNVQYDVDVNHAGQMLLRLHVEVSVGSREAERSEYEGAFLRDHSLDLARRIAEAQGYSLVLAAAPAPTPDPSTWTIKCAQCGRHLPDTDEHRCGHACDTCQGICYAQCGHAAREHECRTCMEAK